MKEKKEDFIKLDRGIRNSLIWEKPSDWYKIWSFILMEARYKTENNYNIPRGCILTKYDYIASQCYVSKKIVENFMKWAKSEGMVVVQKRSRLVLIEVKNWDRFQGSSGTERVVRGSGEGAGSGTIIEERKKERKKEYTSNEFDDQFNTFWSAYPRKQGKAKAREYFIQLIKSKEITLDSLLKSVRAYAKDCRETETTLAHGSTWLFQKRYLDYETISKDVSDMNRLELEEYARTFKSSEYFFQEMKKIKHTLSEESKQFVREIDQMLMTEEMESKYN